jgi:hypothetical protein
MKLATGDVIGVEFCQYPKSTAYILNGMRYRTIVEMLNAFLESRGLELLFGDPDYWMFFRSVSIYAIRPKWQRWINPFVQPLYQVYFDECLSEMLSTALSKAPRDDESQAKAILTCLKTYMEGLAAPQKQTCTIYN